jgi:NO-binding membrane sensor protein with MHYT domain
MVVTGTYNPYLVALSILVASYASYTALDLGGHVADAHGLVRQLWLVAAAITMGSGIWSMHFIGMLAFILPMPIAYDLGFTILSLAVAMLVTGGAFYIISRDDGAPLRLGLSGIFMGLGIAAMHYTGMAAMSGQVGLSYYPRLVVLSVIIAIIASTTALWLAFRTTELWQKLVAAAVMGFAISGMHYTGMAAAICTARGAIAGADKQASSSLDQTNLALVVAGVAFAILAGASIASVSEKKRAEEALRQARLDLAHAHRVTIMGQLTASIAHEINQPIAAVVISASAALRFLDARPPDLQEARGLLDDIKRDGNRAGEIVGRIRALVKKVPPRKDRLDMNEAILEVISLTRSEITRKGVSLRTDLASGLPSVHGDRIQLQQVVLNLILNAVEAMSAQCDGTRELMIATGEDGAEGVSVTVRDSGPGLDPEGLERLFDAFYSTKPGGMGMGLAICRSIIVAHGGKIFAAANVPRGAVFRFTLPRLI